MAAAFTEDSLTTEFQRLKYNMLDCRLTARMSLANPNKEYSDLKKLSHQALAKGRDQMKAEQNDQANSSFAFAYQMRCVCDFIWKRLLNKSGDQGHAKYLKVSRKFSQYATKKLTPQQMTEVEALIAAIRD